MKRNGCVFALLVIAGCGGEAEANDTANGGTTNGGTASGDVYEPLTSTQNDDGAVCLSQRPDAIAIRVVFDRKSEVHAAAARASPTPAPLPVR